VEAGCSSNGVGVHTASSPVTPVSSFAQPSESSIAARTAARSVSFNHLFALSL